MKNFNTNRDFIIKTDRNTNAEVNSYNNPKANANACDGKF